jgi:hypothetical protein
MTHIDTRAALLLTSLYALMCGACGSSGNSPPATGDDGDADSGLSEPDAATPDDATGPDVSDAIVTGDATGPSAPDATQDGPSARDGNSSPGADAQAPVFDGASDSIVQSGIDATAPRGDASSDATTSDAGPKGADASPSRDGASSDAASSDSGDAAPSNDGAASDAAQGDASAKVPFKGIAGSNCAELVSLNVSWWYDWGLDPTGCTSTPFVPQIWGQGTSAAIASSIANGVAAGYKYVLGFNEPDNATQSNIPVATAISLWPAFNNPAVLIGSPATQGNATGLAWIQAFMAQVNADTTGTLRVDFIATHWYGWDAGACDPAANGLQSWIAGIEAIPGNRPIWLTEWGCMNASNPNAATVQAFYAGALAMFAKHPRLVRYAWYQWNTYNEVIDADSGALTALGTAYANAPAYH